MHVSCSPTNNDVIQSWFFADLSPPTVSPESLTINEGDDNMNIFCLSSSPRALDVVEMWLNPQMMVAEEGVGNALSFVNISRSQSGVYICTLTSLVTNETESEDFRVTVHCEYCYYDSWRAHCLIMSFEIRDMHVCAITLYTTWAQCRYDRGPGRI